MEKFKALDQPEFRQLRTLIHIHGWGNLMSTIGSLLAEEADKTSGEQSSCLFNCSNTVFALMPFWKACGGYLYPKSMVGDEIGVDDSFGRPVKGTDLPKE
jgi:hypothetical protein